MSNESEKLRMSFDPHTIEHLGVKMYSNIPNAIAELVANAFDADAQNVKIELFDNAEGKSIRIIDDGIGMDFNDINTKFLRIGRKRREDDAKAVSPGGRKVTGKKGLGKLAFFGIGNTIHILTSKDGQQTSFTLDWDQLLGTKGSDYEPTFTEATCDKSLHGTSITLANLKRKSEFDLEGLAISLSKLFNLFDKTFVVTVSLNGGEVIRVDNSLRYKNLNTEFAWPFPAFSTAITDGYTEKGNIVGEIYSTVTPLKPGLRGITLFANGRLVNAAEFFGVSESSHGFSYFTGWLNVDFVDDWKDDVISTDRQSLNWDLPQTEILRAFLKKVVGELERDWRKKRNEKKKREIAEKTKVDIPGWYDKLPAEVLSSVEPIISAIVNDSELSTDKQTEIVQNIHALAPEYPYYHWRHLHPDIKTTSEQYYRNMNYYTAFAEAAKKYIGQVRSKSGSTNSSDRSMMGEVFSGRKLKVAAKYKKQDGSNFAGDTIQNIEEGQHHLSEGIVAGCRNPVAHEEFVELRETGLFSEQDCLDALSLLSHLSRRLDDAIP